MLKPRGGCGLTGCCLSDPMEELWSTNRTTELSPSRGKGLAVSPWVSHWTWFRGGVVEGGMGGGASWARIGQEQFSGEGGISQYSLQIVDGYISR